MLIYITYIFKISWFLKLYIHFLHHSLYPYIFPYLPFKFIVFSPMYISCWIQLFLAYTGIEYQLEGSSLGKLMSSSAVICLQNFLYGWDCEICPIYIDMPTGIVTVQFWFRYLYCWNVRDADSLSYIKDMIRLLGPLALTIFFHSVLLPMF